MIALDTTYVRARSLDNRPAMCRMDPFFRDLRSFALEAALFSPSIKLPFFPGLLSNYLIKRFADQPKLTHLSLYLGKVRANHYIHWKKVDLPTFFERRSLASRLISCDWETHPSCLNESAERQDWILFWRNETETHRGRTVALWTTSGNPWREERSVVRGGVSAMSLSLRDKPELYHISHATECLFIDAG